VLAKRPLTLTVYGCWMEQHGGAGL
jgi:hypothetical protein